MKAVIYNDARLQKVIGELRKEFRDHGYLRIQSSTEKPRTLSQNALAAVWYKQVSDELGEDTAAGVKRFCKLHAGVPILRRDDDDFRSLYDESIKPMCYEMKLKAIGLIRVTSEMNVSQLSEYLEEVRHLYQGRVPLEYPSDWGRGE